MTENYPFQDKNTKKKLKGQSRVVRYSFSGTKREYDIMNH